MLNPDYLLRISEGSEEIASQLHNDIIKRIVNRIMLRIGRGEKYLLTSKDQWQILTLQQAGYLLEDIQKEIAKATKLQQSEIAEAMEDAGVKALDYDDEIYRSVGLSPTPLTQSPELIRLMQRNYDATMGEWTNFTRTTAEQSQRLFLSELDRAYNLVSTGALSYTQAVQEIINTIVSDGVTVTYPTGHTDTIETATLRAVRTGISQATSQIQMARADEMGVDQFIVSSHLGARPSHQVWQGKIFTRQELESTDEGMPALGTATGLSGINCRHSVSPWFDNMDNPFEQYDSEENRKQYEKEQRQRTLERRIRNTKREVMGLKESVDNCKDDKLKFDLDMDYQRKSALLAKQNKAYREYCERNNLKPLSDRIQIAKWDRQQAAAAMGAAKRYENAKGGSVSKVKQNIVENNPFSLEERKKKLSVNQAASIDEAKVIATRKGIRYPQFDKMDIDYVNNILNAVDTLPDDCRPAMIANGKDISLSTQRPLGRKADQWWGVTYDYRSFSIATMQLGYDKTDFDGGLLVGLNTTKYKTLDALTKAKIANNEKYFAKTGRNWSFNTDGKATAYHELGHCFVDVRGLPKDWESLSAKWAEESKCDILLKPDEAFAEAWAAFHLGNERLPKYISDAIISVIGG